MLALTNVNCLTLDYACIGLGNSRPLSSFAAAPATIVRRADRSQFIVREPGITRAFMHVPLFDRSPTLCIRTDALRRASPTPLPITRHNRPYLSNRSPIFHVILSIKRITNRAFSFATSARQVLEFRSSTRLDNTGKSRDSKKLLFIEL